MLAEDEATNNLGNKFILHIDYDSFFASVEQQANPLLRNKPIAVTGSSLSRGVACAASREAKRFGVKTGMPIYKALEICPNLIPVKGDGTKYTYIQKESLKIFNKYTDHVEAFSIDEAFLDLTDTVRFFGTVENACYKIKNELKEKFGEYVTCSIGVAPNKLLAKLASDINKPNGLFVVNHYNLQKVLTSLSLESFCGIGPRLKNRLNAMGIETVTQLQQTPLHILYHEFGNVSGSFIKNCGEGINYDPVKSSEYIRPPKSISHQHTLYRNTRNPKTILNNIQRLTEMVAKRMRNNNVVGRTLHLSLRDADRKWYGFDKKLPRYTNSGTEIYQSAQTLFSEIKWCRETRLVGIGITGLIDIAYTTKPLFPQDIKKAQIITAIDKINDRFGKYVIIPASTVRADQTKDKVSSFLKHE